MEIRHVHRGKSGLSERVGHREGEVRDIAKEGVCCAIVRLGL